MRGLLDRLPQRLELEHEIVDVLGVGIGVGRCRCAPRAARATSSSSWVCVSRSVAAGLLGLLLRAARPSRAVSAIDATAPCSSRVTARWRRAARAVASFDRSVVGSSRRTTSSISSPALAISPGLAEPVLELVVDRRRAVRAADRLGIDRDGFAELAAGTLRALHQLPPRLAERERVDRGARRRRGIASSTEAA